jgi:4'-phosphopantetheinyl transferase
VTSTAWLYLASPIELDDPVRRRSSEALLSAEERARLDAFSFEQGRREFLLARVLARRSLSRHAPVSPEAWRFELGEYGRPLVASPRTRLSFNLSHTQGLAACVVSGEAEVGVDIEALDRNRETIALADRYFSPAEAAAVRAPPEAARRDRFFEYWTLKEAYLKACGIGLSLPMSHFSFDLSEGAPIGVRFAPSLCDEPSRWSFALLRPTPRHVAAVALRFDGAAPELRVSLRYPLLE